jgi:eukaryotic-like serine/threonine-protein kinase
VIDIGSVVNGKYRLVRILGDGGMGSVYEAQHTVLGTRVAVKVLHPDLVRRTGLVERFLQEARVAAQIRSPHVVQVIDVDRTPEGHAYIVMELLEGEPLSGVLDRQRRLPVGTACEYTMQVLAALEAAHSLGVVHRDLKPENVFVTFAGGRPVLKLIDFGIAKARRLDPRQKNLTVAGVVMGTAEYMAPEQARGADTVDARADLYAVGVLLYEMIAGARPVKADGGADARIIALKVERGEVIPLLQVAPQTPRDVAGLVHHAMAARADMRFSTATEMRLALEGAMTGKRPSTGARVAAPGLGSGGTVAMQGPAQRNTAASSSPPAVAMGATSPANAASEPEPHVDTVRAPPIAPALTPAAYAGVGMPVMASVPNQDSRRRRRVPLGALIGLSLLLGASVVGILVGTGTLASSSPPAEPVSGPAATSLATLPPATTAAPEATTAAGPSQVPTLSTTRAVPSGARPVASNRPAASADADAGPAPFVFPTSLPSVFPPFPSVFPLPAGFPSALPSGFPSSFPGWPSLPTAPAPKEAPQPSPKEAASSVPAGY